MHTSRGLGRLRFDALHAVHSSDFAKRHIVGNQSVLYIWFGCLWLVFVWLLAFFRSSTTNREMDAGMTDHSLFVASLAETFWAVGTGIGASAAHGIPS
jgi:hypothetical protein